MIFTKRVIAPIAFAWTLAAAGMAAVALTAGPGGGTRINLEDVQVGERNNQTRIALICDAPCIVEKLGAREFLLRGVDASLEVDLSARADNVSALHASTIDEGALLSVSTVAEVEYANTKSCTVGGRAAACIDLFFDLASHMQEKVAVAAPSVKAPTSPSPASAGTTQKPGPSLREETSAKAIVAKVKAEAPVLREGAPERMMTFAHLAPPERLTPPSRVILAKVQPVEETIEIKRPSIRTEEPLVASGFDYSERVTTILGKDLTSSYCNNAKTQLTQDAWALGAMVDAALCAAADGKVAQADAMLSRLLEYTPDNYEALVGRALIAVEAEEKSVARKYFQDALNALPPIEESNRIVEAMAEL